MKTRVAVIFPRLGPYHLARLRAAAERFEVTAIELSATDHLHAWEPHQGALTFDRVTLFESTAAQPEAAQVDALREALGQADPEVVAVNGWAEPTSLAALEWCLDQRVPAIVMSESSAEDNRRTWWREVVKRRIVAKYSAALVGGQSHARYLRALGMDSCQISLGYDAVDNDYFSQQSSLARQDATGLRSKLGLPERYVLASARFVARKNLEGLIRAFALIKESKPVDWGVCILGDGELRPHLIKTAQDLGVSDCIKFPGFVQYDDLPVYYGLAQIFVHPSLSEQWGLVVNEAMACGLPLLVSQRCGCCHELVHDGVNGFRFCPEDVERFSILLNKSMNDVAELTTMGAKSRDIISGWGPERFADGLASAVDQATKAPKRLGEIDRLIFRHVRRGRLETSWFSNAVM